MSGTHLKPFSLKALFDSLSVSSKPKTSAYTLELLGTDTKFTPTPNENYLLGETLSFNIQLLTHLNGETATIEKEAPDMWQLPWAYSAPSADLLNGPETFGRNVGDRVARGVFLVLQAILQGKTEITIAGHSRGACETILVAHEISRIIAALLSTKKSLKDILLETPCKYTLIAFQEFFGKEEVIEEPEMRAKLIGRLTNPAIKKAIFQIDPVPGTDDYGLITWYDERFFDIPSGWNVTTITYQDELSSGFRPAFIPEGQTGKNNETYRLMVIDGHHGMGSGGFAPHQAVFDEIEVLKALSISQKDIPTSDVQKLILCKLWDALDANTTILKDSSERIATLNTKNTNLEKFAKEYLPATPQARRKIQLGVYDKILENRQHYQEQRERTYALKAEHKSPLANVKGHRIIHSLAEDKKSFENTVGKQKHLGPLSSFGRGKCFANLDHAYLFLLDTIEDGLEEASAQDHIAYFTKGVVEFLNRYFAKDGHREDDQQSGYIASTAVTKTFSLLLNKISQSYLSDSSKLGNKDHLIKAIQGIFRALDQMEKSERRMTAAEGGSAKARAINELRDLFKKELSKTISQRYTNLLEGAAKATELLKNIAQVERMKLTELNQLYDDMESLTRHYAPLQELVKPSETKTTPLSMSRGESDDEAADDGQDLFFASAVQVTPGDATPPEAEKISLDLDTETLALQMSQVVKIAAQIMLSKNIPFSPPPKEIKQSGGFARLVEQEVRSIENSDLRIKQLNRDNDALLLMIQKLRQEKDQVAQDLARQKSSLAVSRDSQLALDTENNSLKASLKDLQARLVAADQQAQLAQQESQRLLAEQRAKAAEVEKLQRDIASEIATNAAVSQTVTQLQGSVQAKEQALVALQSQKAQAEQRAQALQAERDSILAGRQQLETAHATLQNTLAQTAQHADQSVSEQARQLAAAEQARQLVLEEHKQIERRLEQERQEKEAALAQAREAAARLQAAENAIVPAAPPQPAQAEAPQARLDRQFEENHAGKKPKDCENETWGAYIVAKKGLYDASFGEGRYPGLQLIGKILYAMLEQEEKEMRMVHAAEDDNEKRLRIAKINDRLALLTDAIPAATAQITDPSKEHKAACLDKMKAFSRYSTSSKWKWGSLYVGLFALLVLGTVVGLTLAGVPVLGFLEEAVAVTPELAGWAAAGITGFLATKSAFKVSHVIRDRDEVGKNLKALTNPAAAAAA